MSAIYLKATDQFNRELLRYAVQVHITCRHCGDVLDVGDAVHVSMRGRSDVQWFGCAACWGRAPVTIGDGPVEVIDGRLLNRVVWRFASWGARKRKRKGAA